MVVFFYAFMLLYHFLPLGIKAASMRWFLVTVFSVLVFSGFTKDLTRSVFVPFSANCSALNEHQIDLILNEYLQVSKGDWLVFKTIDPKELINNRSLAIKNSKIRNRLISEFLISNGLSARQMKRTYSSYECLWVNKPQSYMPATVVNHKTVQQSITFNNGQGGTLTTYAGRMFVFKPMIFDAFSADEITIVVAEYATKEDFVKHGVTAMGTEGQLESKGMYFVEAFVNGDPIKLRRNASYQLMVPKNGEAEGFFAYYGKEKNGQLLWQKNESQPFAAVIEDAAEDVEYIIDTLLIDNGLGELDWIVMASELQKTDQLVGRLTGLGWINCDRFYESGTKVEVAFTLNNGNSKSKYNAYMVFHDINSVLPLYSVTNGTFKSPLIPLGAEVTVLFISTSRDLTVQYAFQKIKVGDVPKINLNTEAILSTELEKLMLDIVY